MHFLVHKLSISGPMRSTGLMKLADQGPDCFQTKHRIHINNKIAGEEKFECKNVYIFL